MNNRLNPFSLQFGHQEVQPPTLPISNQPTSSQSPYHTSPQNYPPQQNYPYQQQNVSNQPGGINNLPQQQNSFSQNHQQNIKAKNNSEFQAYDTSINIETLSPKQLLCQCIDLATSMLKQVVDSYTTNNDIKCPYEGRRVIDFSFLTNYILDPARLETILSQFLTQDDQSVKALVKSWLFEMKYIRNLWAHSEKINYRLAFRGYDTLSLLFDSFGGDQNSALYRKIETYRKALLIAQAKSGVF